MKNIITDLKKLTFFHWAGVFLIFSALFLRFYNLKDTLQFQGDQGRDAIIVADIFRKWDPVFIGPVTSVGNMYLGPFYYYFMLPFLMFTYPSPLGPAYAVAALGVATAYFLYMLGKDLVGRNAAFIATAFFTFSATVVLNTRFSWNPNPAPFFSLLMVYFTNKAWRDHPRFWIWVAVCFSILVQLHYLTLLSLGGAGIIWLVQAVQLLKSSPQDSKRRKHLQTFFISTLVAIAIFLLSLTPLILFDLKHENLNRNALVQLLEGEEAFKQSSSAPFLQRVTETLQETEGRGLHILFEMAIGKNRQLNRFLLFSSLMLFLGLIANPLLKKKVSKDLYYSGKLVLAAYLFTGILGTALYEHTIFDHYIAYLFPITFLIYGVILNYISKHLVGKLFAVFFFLFFLTYNLPKMPLKTIGWTLDDIERVSAAISEQTLPGEKYNIVLLSESRDHYGQNYRYFLTTSAHPPQAVGSINELDTLYIIDEEKKAEVVTDLPIYDIVVFPNKAIHSTIKIDGGPDIFVLRK